MFGNLRNKQFLKQQGFSFVEVPIALFIIAVIFLLYNAAANSLVLNKTAKHQELGARIGINVMEDLRAGGFDSLPVSGPLSHPLLGSLPNSSLNLNVVDLNANLKQITVTINWKEANLQARNLKYSTLISRFGM